MVVAGGSRRGAGPRHGVWGRFADFSPWWLVAAPAGEPGPATESGALLPILLSIQLFPAPFAHPPNRRVAAFTFCSQFELAEPAIKQGDLGTHTMGPAVLHGLFRGD